MGIPCQPTTTNNNNNNNISTQTDLKFEVVFDVFEDHIGDISLEEAARAQHQYFLYQGRKESLQKNSKR